MLNRSKMNTRRSDCARWMVVEIREERACGRGTLQACKDKWAGQWMRQVEEWRFRFCQLSMGADACTMSAPGKIMGELNLKVTGRNRQR